MQRLVGSSGRPLKIDLAAQEAGKLNAVALVVSFPKTGRYTSLERGMHKK